ncbi:MAG: cation:proton antiporter [Cyclobacteriaceae bacterium]
MELHILQNICIMFAVAIGVVVICNTFKIPFLIGYLLTGVVLSPNNSPLLGEAHEVEMYAEIGVVLLLFSVGLEFSFSNLKKLKKYVLLGGLFQMAFTIAITAILLGLMSMSMEESIFWGFVTSLSSTAIVIKVLQDKMMLGKEHGRIILSYLLFQDIALVPLMLFTPILAGAGGDPLTEVGMLIVKLLVMVGLALVLAKWTIPWFLRKIMTLQSQEVFLIATILIVTGIALLTSYLGLSLSLGAFLAGLIIAETDYNKIAISCFVPFRYVFICFFFISMGMLLDYHIFITDWPAILFWLVFILLVKVVAGLLASLALKVSWKTSLIIGLSIAQIGEFSFVLSKTGQELGLITQSSYHIFLAVAILTMALAPILVSNAEPLQRYLHKIFHFKKTKIIKML